MYGLGGRTGRSGGGRDAGSRGRRGALPILGVLGPREAITREEAAATVTTRPVLNTERANGGDRRLWLAPLPGPASDGAVSPGPLHGRTHPPTHTHAHPEVDGDPLTGKSEEGVFVFASLGLLRLGGRRSPPGWRRRLPPCFLPSRSHPGFSGAGGATMRPRLSSRLRAAAAHRRLPSPSLARPRHPVLVPDGDPPTGPSIRSYDRRLEPDTFKIKHMNSSSHVLKMWVPLASLRVPQARSQEDHSSTSALTHSLIRHLWARSPPLTASCSRFKFWSGEEGGLLLVALGRGGGRV